MKLEYTLDEDDFIQYHLFVASNSESIKKRRLIMRFLIPSIYLVFAFLEYSKGKTTLSIIFLVLSIIWFILYPIYTKYRYRKHYIKSVNNNYKNSFFKPIKLEVTSDLIITEDFTGETKTKISEIKSLTEIKETFFLNITTNASIIIPKRGIKNINHFKEEFVKLAIPIENKLNWKWK
ncbi:YcxB family protein [Seonamhaeicola sp. ML3]|uniref:YcxB family protein n=1 Tax=Seonamhaeicola sp. ML3 TaxID=2937786 RepID=UPI00200E387E|nr:YcxB family protein [Seonamhaeicola sp. ML3]